MERVEEKTAAPMHMLRRILAKRRSLVNTALKHEGAPKGFAQSISAKDADKAWMGYKRKGTDNESIVTMPLTYLAGKAVGKNTVGEATWKYMNAPALKLDTAAGRALGKIPGMKGLFTTTEKVPWGKPSQKLLKEIQRSSALAPLVKIKDIATPIIVGVGLEKGVRKLTGKPMDQELREKVASTMLNLHSENKEHTKRAHATRLLFKKAEMGLEQAPQNFDELQEKVAALMTQDLVVLEKALELAGGQLKLGELDHVTSSSLGATEKFQAAILGSEF